MILPEKRSVMKGGESERERKLLQRDSALFSCQGVSTQRRAFLLEGKLSHNGLTHGTLILESEHYSDNFFFPKNKWPSHTVMQTRRERYYNWPPRLIPSSSYNL